MADRQQPLDRRRDLGVGADDHPRSVALDRPQDDGGGAVGRQFQQFGERPPLPLDLLRRCPLGQTRTGGNGRGDAAGVHGGDADGRAGEFVPQRFREAAHGIFARGVSGLAGRGDEAEEARHVDDARRVACAQHRQEGTRHPHHAEEVDGEQPVEIGLVDHLERAADGDAGVVDEQVEAAVRGADVGRQRRDGVAIGDVEPVRRHARARRFRPRHPARLREAGLVDIRQCQMRAAPRQRHSQRPADAAGGARDEGCFSLELHRSKLFM